MNMILFSLEKLHLRRITLPLNYDESIARANTPCTASYICFSHTRLQAKFVCACADFDLSHSQERVRIDAAKSVACTSAAN